MDTTAVFSASEHLSRAEAALQAMKLAQTLAEIETAWSDFLIARNSDEHGISSITEQIVPILYRGVGPGSWRFDSTPGPGGTMTITALGGQEPGKSKFVE